MIEHRELRSICHASIGTNNLARAQAFYTPLLATLGIPVVSEYEHAVAYGKGYPEFWLQQPFDKMLRQLLMVFILALLRLASNRWKTFIDAQWQWVVAVMAHQDHVQNMAPPIMAALSLILKVIK